MIGYLFSQMIMTVGVILLLLYATLLIAWYYMYMVKDVKTRMMYNITYIFTLYFVLTSIILYIQKGIIAYPLFVGAIFTIIVTYLFTKLAKYTKNLMKLWVSKKQQKRYKDF